MSELPEKNLWDRLNNLALVRFLLLFACGWALVQLLAYFKTVIVIFTFAAVLAFLLSYPVRWLHRYLPYGIAAILVFFLSLIIISSLTVTLGLAVLSQGQQLINSVISILYSLGPLVEQLEEFLRKRNIQVNLNAIEAQIRELALSGIGYSLAFLQASLTNIVILILIAVVAFFMLLNGAQLWTFFLKRFVPKSLHSHFTNTVHRNFLGFFRGQLILMVFLTVSTFTVFVSLQVPFPLILSLIVGVVDAIPGIGATLGVMIVCLILLTQGVWLALKTLVACVVLQQIQDNLIAPRVMQNSLNVNPVVIFFALLVGGKVAGLLGIFLAVPIAGVIVSLLEIDEMKGEP
jgi:predicted PurR-regulated permease PerM